MTKDLTIKKLEDFINWPEGKQPCPQCGEPIGTVTGSKEAICSNCGYKDPCCE